MRTRELFTLLSILGCALGLTTPLLAAEDGIVVHGGRALSTREVRRALSGIKTPPDSAETRAALAGLGAKLIEEGYLEAEIRLSTPRGQTPSIDLVQGSPARWDTVRVTAVRPKAGRAVGGPEHETERETDRRTERETERRTESEAAARAVWPGAGERFDPGRLEELLWDWCDRWAENGHPFAEAKIESLVVRDGMVRVGLRLDPGPLLTVEELRFPGRTVTREEFLHRWLRFRPGLPYRESDWAARRRRLEQSGLFTRVGTPVLETIPAKGSAAGDSGDTHVPSATGGGEALRIWMPVEETRHNRMEAAVGYSGSSRKLSGFADLDLANLFGTGRSFGIRWDRLDRDQSRLRLNVREPLLGPLPIGLRGSLEQELRDSTYTRLVGELLLETVVAWDLTAFAGGEYHRSLVGREPSERILRTSSVVGGGWATLRPGEWRGGQAEGTFRSGRSRIRPAGGGASRSVRLNKADLTAERYWPLSGSLVLRTSFQASALSPDDSLPPSEALRFGGAGSVRGYAEEQFMARRYGAGQLELGLGLANQRIYVFADGGAFRRFQSPVRNLDVWGFGIGLVSETPSRRVALDLGIPRGGSLGNGRLHLRVETRF